MCKLSGRTSVRKISFRPLRFSSPRKMLAGIFTLRDKIPEKPQKRGWRISEALPVGSGDRSALPTHPAILFSFRPALLAGGRSTPPRDKAFFEACSRTVGILTDSASEETDFLTGPSLWRSFRATSLGLLFCQPNGRRLTGGIIRPCSLQVELERSRDDRTIPMGSSPTHRPDFHRG